MEAQEAKVLAKLTRHRKVWSAELERLRRHAHGTLVAPRWVKSGFHGANGRPIDCYCYLPLYVFCGRHLDLADRPIKASREALYDALHGRLAITTGSCCGSICGNTMPCWSDCRDR
jgi:hypothetical protein